MRFIAEKLYIDEPQFTKLKSLGRKLYEYRPITQNIKEFRLQETDLFFFQKNL